MRKILYVLGLILILLTVNFTLWFMHTRTIHSAVSGLKKQLALYKIDLSYEDLYFNNFKSWNVAGTLSKVKLRVNSKNPHVLKFDHISIYSNPIKEHVELQTQGGVTYSRISDQKEDIYDIKFHNGSPSVEIYFLTSLNSLSNSMESSEDETPPLLRNIKSIKYYDSGFDLTDVSKNSRYLTMEGSKFSLASQIKASSRRYDTVLDVKGLRFDPEYASELYTSTADKLNIESGINNIHTDISMVIQPSENQLEFIKKLKEKDKNAEFNKVLDSFQIIFNDATFSSDHVTSSIKGSLNKQPSSGFLPYIDISIQISDYKKCADRYFSSLNDSITQLSSEQPILPIKKINPEQIEKFKKFLSQFSDNGQDLSIQFKRLKDSELTISGKSAADLMSELQATFFANFEVIEKPKSDLPSRLSNVAK
jgi:hypothetical protein